MFCYIVYKNLYNYINVLKAGELIKILTWHRKIIFIMKIFHVFFFQIDLVEIKECFLEMTGMKLANWISDETQGDYQRLLFKLL